jgi:hypothetical protein
VESDAKSVQEERPTLHATREILRNAVRERGQAPARLGSRITARFAEIGLDEPIPELRGEPARLPRSDP